MRTGEGEEGRVWVGWFEAEVGKLITATLTKHHHLIYVFLTPYLPHTHTHTHRCRHHVPLNN